MKNASSAGINLIFFCQSVDGQDPVVADTYQRVLYLSQDARINHIDVIAIKGREVNINTKVQVHVLGLNGNQKLRLLARFYQLLWSIGRKRSIDICYLYMTPTRVPLFFLMKPFFNYKIVLWFAHSIYTWKTRLSIYLFTDRWLSVNKAQGNLPTSKLRLVGQGVDTDLFKPPEHVSIKYDLITVGRITPAKKLELIIDVLDYCRKEYGLLLNLLIGGGCYLPEDKIYKEKLEDLIRQKGLQDAVIFAGPIPRPQLPKYLHQSRIFIFTVPGGVGKATMEALACGLPVVLAEPTAGDFFGAELADYFLCERDIPDLSSKVFRLLNLSPDEKSRLDQKIRHLIDTKCSMKIFTTRIVDELVDIR